MNKQKALYISTRLLSDAYQTFETIQQGDLAVGIDLACESFGLFNRIADLIVDYYDREETIKSEMEEVKHRLDLDRIEYKKQLNEIEEKYKDTQQHDMMLRKCASEVCDEMKYVNSTIDKYDIDENREIQDYQIQSLRILNRLLASLL